MNKESEQKMQISRCGNHDKSVWTSLQMRVRKYAFMGTKWLKPSLTYKITKYSKKISHAELDNSASKAFKVFILIYKYRTILCLIIRTIIAVCISL